MGLSRGREGPLTAEGREGMSRAEDRGARLPWRAEMPRWGGLAMLVNTQGFFTWGSPQHSTEARADASLGPGLEVAQCHILLLKASSSAN